MNLIKNVGETTAILGYEELARYLDEAGDDGTPAGRMRAVAFALDHPGRFRLMFRKDFVNRTNPVDEETSNELLAFRRSHRAG
ncbi:hypothetical protein [Rhizobium lentis]|uniref:hypothetical protein n=1 Tax=Rhizobium lentis TaxID=1138194 RepID=UPI001C830486|nr:hypothetical protein [Rhizobium lentis]MBX4998814.1 hypothetical protein [Rhizobium lentis]MBX5017723.1 hypothetical protein [Rhizobium lentis]